MGDRINVLVMGGRTEKFHQFSIMGPIFETFLTGAGFSVTLTEDRDYFKADQIAPFDVIVVYTTRDALTDDQAAGLLGGIANKGKGFVGIHSASDSFLENRDYLNMVGAKFLSHPKGCIPLTFNVKNRHHPVMKGIEDFQMDEELYLMETYGHFDLLMTTWYRGFKRPITWIKPYGKGRVFYTALGHRKEQTEHPHFQQLIINAVDWVHNPV